MSDVIDSLMAAVAIELVKAQGFNFQPAKDRPKTVHFQKDQTFSADSVLKCWRLRKHRNMECVELVVYDDAEAASIYAVFRLDRMGTWEGREVKNSGPCFLQPIVGGVNVWPSLQHVGDFERRAVQLSDEDGFLYREELPPQIDWGPFQFNLSDSIKLNNLVSRHTAIAIVTCDRLDYIETTVQSIALCHSVLTYPIFVFMDQPVDPGQAAENFKAATTLVKKYLPSAILIKRPRNFGCGRNIIDARRQLFDHMGFERVFMFEDDMIVAPSYLDVCSRAMSIAQSEFTNVAAVQGWSECKMSANIRRSYINALSPSVENWWGYLMSKSAWDAMKTFIYRYEEMFLGGAYDRRPHESIQSWFRLKLRSRLSRNGSKPAPEFASYTEDERLYLSSIPTGQDGATMIAMIMAGYVKLSTLVTRGQYIGEHGISTTPTTFSKFGYGTIKLIEVDTPALFDGIRVIDRKTEGVVDVVTAPGMEYVNLVEGPADETAIHS